MNSTMLRLIAAGLCTAAVLCSLASCADPDKPEGPADTGRTEETALIEPTFEDADFDGKTFTILSAQDEATDFIDHYIDNEERTGEPINDAVVERNTDTEEKYNVDIVRRSAGVNYANQAAKAGTVDFELCYDWGFRLVPSALEGIFYDFNQMPVIDQSRSYWAPSVHDDLTVADKMLITTCDISMNRISWAYFLFFNKRIMDDLHIEYPYANVDSNTWTIDTFLTMVIGSEQDDGDTIWSPSDRYGFASSASDCLETLVDSVGDPGTIKNDDGTYTLNIYNEKLTNIFSQFNKRMQTSNAFGSFSIEEWTAGMDISRFDSIYKAARHATFAEGHTMFGEYSMDIAIEFSDMTDKYGVVPKPKYDSAQADYYHTIDYCAPMFAVPKQADTDFVGTVMEFMAYRSEQLLLPAFYEQTIKTKNMSDEEGRDERMLDIIRDSVHYSWTQLYYQQIFDPNGASWDPCYTIRHEMLASGNFASVYKRYKSAAESSIEDIYDRILALDVNK